MTNDYKQPKEPQKTPEQLDAAIERFTKACAGAVPDLERDEPEQPKPRETEGAFLSRVFSGPPPHKISIPQPAEQPGAPADEPEQVVAALNARKWRGRDDWVYWPHDARILSTQQIPIIVLQVEDAAAIVRGLQAQAELAEIRAEESGELWIHDKLKLAESVIQQWTERCEKMQRQLDCLCDICGEDMGQDAACMRCYYTQRGLLPGGPYDDTQPVLAALETLVGDQHATDAQRRAADRAAAEIKILQKRAAQPPAQPDLDAIEARLIAKKCTTLVNPDGVIRSSDVLDDLRRLRAGPVVGTTEAQAKANYHWAVKVITELITAIAFTKGAKENARLMEAVANAEEFRQEFAAAPESKQP